MSGVERQIGYAARRLERSTPTGGSMCAARCAPKRRAVRYSDSSRSATSPHRRPEPDRRPRLGRTGSL